jgi:hypothetical protein
VKEQPSKIHIRKSKISYDYYYLGFILLIVHDGVSCANKICPNDCSIIRDRFARIGFITKYFNF